MHKAQYSYALIALAIFSMALLLSADNIPYVFAFEQFQVALGATPDGPLIYSASSNVYVQKHGSSAIYFTIDALTQEVDSYTLAQQYSMIGEIDGRCVGLRGVAGADEIAIWDCLNGANLSTVLLPASGDELNGEQGGGNINTWVFGSTIYIFARCDTVSRAIWIHYSNALVETGRTGACSSDNKSVPASASIRSFYVADGKLATMTSAGNFYIFPLGSTADRDCSAVLATGQGVLRHNALWYVYTTTSQRIDTINGSCTDTGDITSSQHDLTDTLTHISVNNDLQHFYIQSLTQVSVMDSTNPTVKLFTFEAQSNNRPMGVTALGAEFNQYANVYDTGQMVIITQLEDTTGTGNEQFCIDTNGDGTGDVCYEDTNGDGIPDVGGVLEVISNQNPPARATGKLLCQIGIITDCTNSEPTNTDQKTNGVGLLMFVAILVILMAVVGSALYGKIKIEYNLMLQVAVLLVATGLAVAFDWLDTLWFYAMLFIIIGFASIAGASFIMPRIRGSQSAE